MLDITTLSPKRIVTRRVCSKCLDFANVTIPFRLPFFSENIILFSLINVKSDCLVNAYQRHESTKLNFEDKINSICCSFTG